MSVLDRLSRLRWQVLMSLERLDLEPADVLIGAGGFTSVDNAGRLYDPLFDSCREVFQDASHSVQMVSRLGEAGRGRCFSAGHVPNLPAVERGRLLDSVVIRSTNGRRRTRFEERAWGRLLDSVQPRVVVTFQPPPSLCRAGRLRNIKVFDMQHGVIQENHASYYNIANPVRDEADEWPSEILCWDRRTADIINRVLHEYTSGHVVGHPWLSRFIEQCPGDTIVSAAMNRADEIRRTTSNPIVLVTLQWQPSNRSGLRGELLPAELKRYMSMKRGVSWIVRPHPVQITESKGAIYTRLAKYLHPVQGALPADVSRLLPLPAALHIAAAHVTVDSSAVIEATVLGVPSWQFALKPVFRSSLAQSGTDVSELDRWLFRHVSRERKRAHASELHSKMHAGCAQAFSQELLRRCRLTG